MDSIRLTNFVQNLSLIIKDLKILSPNHQNLPIFEDVLKNKTIKNVYGTYAIFNKLPPFWFCSKWDESDC